MKYARFFSKLKKDLGLTQVRFAKRLGTTQGNVSKICAGKNRPNLEIFLKATKMAGRHTK